MIPIALFKKSTLARLRKKGGEGDLQQEVCTTAV